MAFSSDSIVIRGFYIGKWLTRQHIKFKKIHDAMNIILSNFLKILDRWYKMVYIIFINSIEMTDGNVVYEQ